ncbi:MAG: CsgG/HfaB family protein, partial [Nitrospirota bacterium]|nr:CsgG/HfaB family protein [Nitrospirota bacterium]
MKTFPAVLAAIFFLTGCAAVKPGSDVEQKEQASLLQYIDGTVQRVSGNEIVLSLKLPELKKTSELPINEIAQQVIQKSLFLEGIKIDINGIPAVIKEVRGNVITAALEKAPIFSSGTTIKLQIPKKIIAITDFEVIKGREKEAGRVTLEGLTSALIDSGHFTVVERSKLKTIMDELQLSLSGLTKETPEKVLGKLFMADIILTGTLADISGLWDINLRLVNVRTGHAMAAIAMRTPLFKPTELRDASAFNEDFEGDIVDASWFFGYKKYDKSTYERYVDQNIGAEGSKNS